MLITPKTPPISALGHHSEPGDPELLAWIKDQIDAMVGLGDWVIVLTLGAVIIAIPLLILAFFGLQRMRQGRQRLE